jgi:hypothetical protein
MKKKYVYFVSFYFGADFHTGIGNAEYDQSKLIKNFNEIRNIEKKLKEKHDFENVIIINWQLLRIEEKI